jgi:hypothetical protein
MRIEALGKRAGSGEVSRTVAHNCIQSARLPRAFSIGETETAAYLSRTQRQGYGIAGTVG